MRPSARTDPVRLTVRAASAEYRIDISAGSSDRLAEALDDYGVPRRRFVVSSTGLWRLHGHRLHGVTSEDPILLPDGERFKHLGTVGRIYDALIRAQADRGSAIVAIGGGVVGDVAGFAAATFLRGMPLVHVPTTLLAQVDSAIGGKVGVNHPMGKNLIGAFHQPAAVLIDPEFLKTLPRREFRAGLYEVVKYGVIASRPLFDLVSLELKSLFARDPTRLVEVIADSCGIKASVVEQDERESGPRRTLNFGHTAGHALEAITSYKRFLHGEAVGWGMLAASALAEARGELTTEAARRLALLVDTVGDRPPITDLSAAACVTATARDKKVVAGTLHFVLPVGIGRTRIATDVTKAELTGVLRTLGMRP